MRDFTKNLGNLTVKRPGQEDMEDLLPLVGALAAWFFTSKNKRESLLPVVAAVLAWLVVKGLIYVPR